MGVECSLEKQWESKALYISVGVIASGKDGKRSGWRPAKRRLAAQMPWASRVMRKSVQ